MITTRVIAIAVVIVGGGLALHVTWAQQPGTTRIDRATAPTAASAHGARFRETVTVGANVPFPNLPGKRLISHIVDYPPGGGSDPHRHAGSAFIYAYVLLGRDPEPGW